MRFDISKHTVLALAIYVGCMATLSQVILFRELLVLLEGNELVLSVLLFCWLIGISIGALIPGWLNINGKTHRWLVASLLFLPLTLILYASGIRLSPWILGIPSQESPTPIQMLLVSTVSVLPASFFTGFTFPLLSNALKTVSSKQMGVSAVSSIFTYEAIGSVLGGILILFHIVINWSPFHIAWFSLTALLVFFLLALHSPNKYRIVIPALLLAVLTLYFNVPRFLQIRTSQIRWETRQTGYQLINSLDTPYQHLDLGLRDEQYTVFSNGSPLYSFPDEYTHTQWAYMSMSQNPNPQSTFLIGNAGTEIAPCYLADATNKCSVIEMDAGIKRILEPVRGKSDIPLKRIYWYRGDAIRFYASKFMYGHDFTAINQPDPDNAFFNRYYTREFFESVQHGMRDNGVLAFSVSGTPNYQRGDVGVFCGTLYWTLRDVFPNVLVVPGTEWWFFASPKRELLSDPQAVIQQFKDKHPATSGFSPGIFSIYYDKSRIDHVHHAFEEYKHYPRNRDTRPLCYLYKLLLWSKQYGYLKWLPVRWFALSGWPLAGLSIAIGLLIFFGSAIFMRLTVPHGKSVIPLLVLFTAGLSSMSAEIIILLYYQSRFGYLYQQAGIFFAVFMAGLACGITACNRYLIRKNKPTEIWLFRTIWIFTILLLISPTILSHVFMMDKILLWTERFRFLLWLGILSFVMGLILPLVARTIEEQGTGLLSMAGWVDACDCAGGAVGSILTGILLVPVIGLMNAFYLLAGLNALCVLSLYYWRFRRQQ